MACISVIVYVQCSLLCIKNYCNIIPLISFHLENKLHHLWLYFNIHDIDFFLLKTGTALK